MAGCPNSLTQIRKTFGAYQRIFWCVRQAPDYIGVYYNVSPNTFSPSPITYLSLHTITFVHTHTKDNVSLHYLNLLGSYVTFIREFCDSRDCHNVHLYSDCKEHLVCLSGILSMRVIEIISWSDCAQTLNSILTLCERYLSLYVI